MAIFQPYEGLIYKMKKDYESINGRRIRREDMPDMMHKLLDIGLTCLPTFQGSINQETLTVLFEMSHYLLSHKVYHVETGMAQSLMKTEISLNLHDLKLPYKIFEVSFKDDLRIPAGKIPSVLAVVTPGRAEIDSCNAFLRNRYKISDSAGNMLYLRYVSPEGGICHSNIPAEFFLDRSIDEAMDMIGDERRDTFQFTDKLSSSDKMIQRSLLRTVMGLMCYINTESPDVRLWKNKNRPAMGTLKPEGYLVGSTLPDSWFMRRGHFMVLKHERYRRQDGAVRVVWRRPHEVVNKGRPLMPDARGEVIDHDRE